MLKSTQPLELSNISVCRIGQETVKDILNYCIEVFRLLSTVEFCSVDKKERLEALLRTIRILFKRLRLVYEKCNESTLQGMDYTDLESLVPYQLEQKNNERLAPSCAEREQVQAKVVQVNQQLKQVIDKMRQTCHDINIMLAMKKT